MINFNIPPMSGSEEKYVLEALKNKKMSGDGYFGKKCQMWFENKLIAEKTLLTPSCTSALEMSAILIGIRPGDEVIMPSYTFVSTANAFVLRGAKIIFVDIHPQTMNIDASKIESAISKKTKAIVPVHYAGVSCDMDAIMEIAERHELFVVEDAAQCFSSSYKGKALGTIGHFGAMSFHETKNITSGGEGGLLIINDATFVKDAEIVREKGTNRSQFFRGSVDKYTWMDVGSSYLPSELQAAYLWGQIQCNDKITQARLSAWKFYFDKILHLEDKGLVEIPKVPISCQHNGHLFSLKLKDKNQRALFIDFLKLRGVMAVFHYVPLHSSPAGKKYGVFIGDDNFTTVESERLVRLPIFYGITETQQEIVVDAVKMFFKK